MVYLHIGLNKTGTSTLQGFFAHHRDRLAAEGILYPQAGLRGTAHYDLSAALGFNRWGDPPSPERIRQLGEQLRAEIQRIQPRKILISSEMFVLPGEIERVRHFFADCEVYVVIYLRRHDNWWISAYNQSVRAVDHPGWAPGFRNYLDFQRRNPNRWYLNYRRFVDAWAAVFGHTSIVVRPYERLQNQPSLLHDFLRAMGEGAFAVPPPSRLSVNRSVSLEALQLIDIYQRTVTDGELRARLIAWVIERYGDGHPFDLPLEWKRRLVAENQADYEYIARQYLGRSDGRLFLDPLSSTTDVDLEESRRMPVLQVMAETMRALREIRRSTQRKETGNA